MTPHSTWLGAASELGIPALLVLFGMIWSSFVLLGRAQRYFETNNDGAFLTATVFGIKTALAAFCVTGSFLGQHLSWSLYVLVAISAALGTMAQRLAGDIMAANQAKTTAVRRGASTRHNPAYWPALRHEAARGGAGRAEP